MNLDKAVSVTILLIIPAFNFSSAQDNFYKPFNLDFTREAIILGTGTAAAITSLLILGSIEPLTPEEINLLNPSDVKSFDRNAIGPFKEDHAGDVLLYTAYLLPLGFLAYEKTNRDFLELALIYGEVILIQGSLNGIVKGTVLRTRPFVYDPETPMSEKTTTNARISFFSGHTSMTTALSFFTAKVFTEYIEDNTAKILIWTGAALLPAATALTRVNAHWHFPSDVMVGYAIGALVGYIIPELHKSKINDKVLIMPSYNINRPAVSVRVKF